MDFNKSTPKPFRFETLNRKVPQGRGHPCHQPIVTYPTATTSSPTDTVAALRLAISPRRVLLLLPPSQSQARRQPLTHRARRGFQLTAPHDKASLQLALNEVIQRLATNKLDVHRASLLLYSLQLAGQRL